MSTFKIGDRVRRINVPFDARMVLGYEGTVTAVSSNGLCINVDNHTIGCDPAFYTVRHFELIEETQVTTPVPKNMKIRIKDAEHSRLVQETLFEMGTVWNGGNKDVRNEHYSYLYVNNSHLSHGNKACVFNEEPSEEVELVTTYSFKPVDREAKRKAAEKEALQKSVAEMQKQLDEMKQKLESL